MSAALNAWPFVIVAYGVAVGGTVALVLWSLVALRRAESRAEALDGSRTR
jgi:hypothetical protein